MLDMHLFQRGKVVRLDGSGAHIVFESLAGCSACAAGQGCGLATLAALLAKGQRAALQVGLAAPLGLAVGDTVRVSINARRLLQLVAATYLGPLIGIAAGAVVGSVLLPSLGDAGAVIGAVAGGGLASWLLLASAGRRRSLAWLGAQVTRVGVTRLE